MGMGIFGGKSYYNSHNDYNDALARAVKKLRSEITDDVMRQAKKEVKKRIAISNPDPRNFRIIEHAEINGYLIAQIKYPDAKNFEGMKILVYQGKTYNDLMNQTEIDPHFHNDTKSFTPIARFVPTREGWRMAEIFVGAMSQGTRDFYKIK